MPLSTQYIKPKQDILHSRKLVMLTDKEHDRVRLPPVTRCRRLKDRMHGQSWYLVCCGIYQPVEDKEGHFKFAKELMCLRIVLNESFFQLALTDAQLSANIHLNVHPEHLLHVSVTVTQKCVR